ncbi:MAG: hypothetical protein PHS24_04595, partial [Bacilli bacterium]|nr:hypothetical protein [Bacilli bacterium]
MKFLISINNKIFEEYSPRELVETFISLDKNNCIAGAEIYINLINDVERKYSLELVRYMKDMNWIVQIHSVDLSNLNEDTIKKFLSYYNELSLVYGKKIKITIHPAEE